MSLVSPSLDVTGTTMLNASVWLYTMTCYGMDISGEVPLWSGHFVYKRWLNSLWAPYLYGLLSIATSWPCVKFWYCIPSILWWYVQNPIGFLFQVIRFFLIQRQRSMLIVLFGAHDIDIIWIGHVYTNGQKSVWHTCASVPLKKPHRRQ